MNRINIHVDVDGESHGEFRWCHVPARGDVIQFGGRKPIVKVLQRVWRANGDNEPVVCLQCERL